MKKLSLYTVLTITTLIATLETYGSIINIIPVNRLGAIADKLEAEKQDLQMFEAEAEYIQPSDKAAFDFAINLRREIVNNLTHQFNARKATSEGKFEFKQWNRNKSLVLPRN